jgi:hypothetical protein
MPGDGGPPSPGRNPGRAVSDPAAESPKAYSAVWNQGG